MEIWAYGAKVWSESCRRGRCRGSVKSADQGASKGQAHSVGKVAEKHMRHTPPLLICVNALGVKPGDAYARRGQSLSMSTLCLHLDPSQ